MAEEIPVSLAQVVQSRLAVRSGNEPVLRTLAVAHLNEPTEGIGIVEAPRGTLIHDYTTDDNGCIKKANLIVGTTHNIAPMNMSVKQAATSLIKGGVYNEGLLNQVEMAVRAYDP